LPTEGRRTRRRRKGRWRMSEAKGERGIFISKSGEKEGRHVATEAGPQKGSRGRGSNGEGSYHF